jgi:hypothetical protein
MRDVGVPRIEDSLGQYRPLQLRRKPEDVRKRSNLGATCRPTTSDDDGTIVVVAFLLESNETQVLTVLSINEQN